MSEFTQNKKLRLERLVALFNGIIAKVPPVQLVKENEDLIRSVVPTDIIDAVDRLVLLEIPIDELKTAINKVINLLSKTILEHPYYPPKKDSFLDVFIQNNSILDKKLKVIRPLIKELNKGSDNVRLRDELKKNFVEIEKYRSLYLIKENVLFPALEGHWKNFRCLQVMWSFHDDIRKNIQAVIGHLSSTDFDLKRFNRLCGDIFFNMYAIKFRDERILFPMILETMSEDTLDIMLQEAVEIGFPYVNPSIDETEIIPRKTHPEKEIDLQTGYLLPEQIRMLFNHLPVDITYVDENNKVKYFSSPAKRIFPRTKAIIGRDVKNCHPPESVHVVEQIVDAFKKGEKSEASFWIKMKEAVILIQYFAVRDEMGSYKGVIEVSQEISEIQNIHGEKRLLDWNK
jgi:hypothetical protein